MILNFILSIYPMCLFFFFLFHKHAISVGVGILYVQIIDLFEQPFGLRLKN